MKDNLFYTSNWKIVKFRGRCKKCGKYAKTSLLVETNKCSTVTECKVCGKIIS